MVKKKLLHLSQEEKDFLKKIAAISCIDESIIKNVLQSLLKVITIHQYAEVKEVYIPYICSLNIRSHEKLCDKGVKTIVKLVAEPCKNLTEEIKAINNGDITLTQNHIRDKFYKNLQSISKK